MTAQEEINQIIFKHNLKETWLANQLGCSPQTLNYQLHTAHKFDTELDKEIRKIFKKMGILTHSPEESKMLNTLTLEFAASQGNNMSQFITLVKKVVEDNSVDNDERLRIKLKLKDFRENFIAQMDELEKLVEG